MVSKFNSLKPLGRFLRPYTGYILIILVASLGSAVTLLSFGMGLRTLVDQGNTLVQKEFWPRSLGVGVLMGATMAAMAFTRYYFSALFAEKVIADLKQSLFQKFLSFSPAFFETFRVGELLSLLNTETLLLKSTLGSYSSTGLRSALQILGGIILLACTSIKLTGTLFILIPLVILPIFFLRKRLKYWSQKIQTMEADESACSEETFNGIFTVQAFCHSLLHFNIFQRLLKKSLCFSKRYILLRGILVASIIMTALSAIAIVLWVGTQEKLNGRLSAGDLSAFIFFAFLVAASLQSLLDLTAHVQRGAEVGLRFLDILNRSSDIQEVPQPYELPLTARGEIKVQDVTFSYPSRPRAPSLQNIFLTLNPGETVALVGPSGAGKSTLLTLLLRFYDPLQGGITLDGIDIRLLPLETLRGKIGIVPQHPYIFSGTLYDNIAYGNKATNPEAVHLAARRAFLEEFILSLPEGYATRVGEKGIRLSGGQKQRLAIARVFLKNPLVLLLDEATNALDAQSEFMVQQALETVMAHRTTLIVAHRLSTVQNADRIVVLKQGKIVTMGTHTSLMAEEGLYRELAELQLRA